MSEDSFIKIRVSDAAKRELTKTARELEMKEIGVASRLIEWFAKQDDAVRKGVLGMYPKDFEAEVARLILEKLAGSKVKVIPAADAHGRASRRTP